MPINEAKYGFKSHFYRRNNMGKMDSMKGIPSTTGAKAPAGATSSDKTGERMEKKVGGVAMGMQDVTGKDKQFNTGKTAGICYEHKRGDCNPC
jgi:hypothetical protein